MPDITSVLERGAAQPVGSPDIGGAQRKMRTRRIVLSGSSAVLLVAITVTVAVLVAPTSRRSTLQVRAASTTTTVGAGPAQVESHGAKITLEPGWVASSEPLDWWTHSPYELFSISTSALPPSPHVDQNEAACYSEIAKTAVDNLPPDGAYLWIGLWRPYEGIYQSKPRPESADGIEYQPGCALPNGEKAYLANLTDGHHDYPVTFVLGRDAPASRKAEIDKMLNSLDLSGAPKTR